MRHYVAALAAAVLLVCSAHGARSAHAKADKSQRTVRYTYEQVWPAAIRFLRIDVGLEIIEKDADAGYVLFLLKEEGKEFRGSLELVRIKDDQDMPALRMLMSIEDRPSYMELGLLDRLERKLRAELGSPPDKPASPPPARSPKTSDKQSP